VSRPAETTPALELKPRLRGVFHQAGFFVAVPAGIALALAAQGSEKRAGAIVFASTVAAMFGASALYHRRAWSPRWRPWLRRLDHAGIFALIAGTYTPVALIVLHGGWQISVLAVAWSGALAGILVRLFWVDAPTWLAALLGILLGWVGVIVFPQLLDRIGLAGTLLLLAGGIFYTLGALIYARQLPNPLPEIFGFHELFHAFTIVAVALHYVVIAFFVLRVA
jgi:hemolysin III